MTTRFDTDATVAKGLLELRRSDACQHVFETVFNALAEVSSSCAEVAFNDRRLPERLGKAMIVGTASTNLKPNGKQTLLNRYFSVKPQEAISLSTRIVRPGTEFARDIDTQGQIGAVFRDPTRRPSVIKVNAPKNRGTLPLVDLTELDITSEVLHVTEPPLENMEGNEPGVSVAVKTGSEQHVAGLLLHFYMGLHRLKPR